LGFAFAGGSYLDLKTSFGISRSSVFRLRDMFNDAIFECSSLEIQFMDTLEEIKKVCRLFEAKSTNRVMQGCVGAMDGMFAKSNSRPELKAMAIQDHFILVTTMTTE
jgi:hypothetical protein